MNCRRVPHALALSLAIALVSSPPTAAFSSGGVVCTKQGISGFDAEAATAKHHLGYQTTSSFDGMKVYLTVQGKRLYVHSNYLAPGGVYPTKLAIDSPMEAWLLVANLTLADTGEAQQLAQAEYSKVTFYVDEEVFRSPFARIDFGSIKRLWLIDSDGNERLARRVTLQDGSDKWEVERVAEVSSHPHSHASHTAETPSTTPHGHSASQESASDDGFDSSNLLYILVIAIILFLVYRFR
jgi:hypothetical protein